MLHGKFIYIVPSGAKGKKHIDVKISGSDGLNGNHLKSGVA